MKNPYIIKTMQAKKAYQVSAAQLPIIYRELARRGLALSKIFKQAFNFLLNAFFVSINITANRFIAKPNQLRLGFFIVR